MRDRLFTPFFPLGSGLDSSRRGDDTPGEVSARALEGRVVGNGRYLLLRKMGHTEGSASFRAKDMLGGIDVDIELHRDDELGFRLGRSDVTPRERLLPNLLDTDGGDGVLSRARERAARARVRATTIGASPRHRAEQSMDDDGPTPISRRPSMLQRIGSWFRGRRRDVGDASDDD